MNTPQASMNTNPDNNIENTMTTKNKTGGNLRCETLFAENCFNAAIIDELELAINAWDENEKIAVDSAEYLGDARWHYRGSYVEGMCATEGDFKFLAITELNQRQFQTFSQATTWLDGVEAGVKEFIDLQTYKQPAK